MRPPRRLLHPAGGASDPVARPLFPALTGGASRFREDGPVAKSSVESRLIGLADLVVAAAQKKRDPEFSIPVRALSNVEFNEKRRIIEMKDATQARTFFNLGMAKKFMQTMLVADALAELQRADCTTSLREIYYRTKHTLQDSSENSFDSQDESDPSSRTWR